MNGPGYLPHSLSELIVWLSLVIAGAFFARAFVVFAYRVTCDK